MCGIVGAVAQRNVVPILIEGLRRLEYRGYDSAGIAILNGAMNRVRSVGRVSDLEARAKEMRAIAPTGIAHTRWATHGGVSEKNAHPHFSSGAGVEVSVVHNGIIENHESLRARLIAAGYPFVSDTDTEVVAHLLHSHVASGMKLFEAMQRTVRELEGAYAIAAIHVGEPHTVVGARRGSPLLLGVGDASAEGCENFLASDTSALLQVTRRVAYLEDGDVVRIGTDGYSIVDAEGRPARRPVVESQLSADSIELGHYQHYMQKEIFEQPGAIANTLEMVTNASSVSAGLFGAEAEEIFARTKHILILACGTSYHAGLVAKYWLEAMQRTVRELEGAYAIAAIHVGEPHTVVGARRGSPLLLGVGDASAEGCENFLASDTSALLQVTRRVAYLEDGDVVRIGTDGYSIVDAEGRPAQRPVVESQLSADSIELGQYQHYMQKEIFEQPGAIANTLEMVTNASSVSAGLFGAEAEEVFARTKHILILACGTSYHAGLVAKYWLEAIAGIPVSVEIASEYRYRESVALPKTLVVTVSQSGETADTLAALQHATTLGLRDSLSICNVAESALIRQSRLRFLTRAGPEIGVASTKAFTTQLTVLFVLALVLARQRKRLAASREKELLAQLRHLPAALNHVLGCEDAVRHWANRFAPKQHALFLGRGVHYPIAQEGALKLKEITYIHAEAYAAGELKHGPLALVDRDMPVVVVAPNDSLIEKLKSNLQEVRARGGELFVFADRDTHIEPSDGINITHIEPSDGINIINLGDHAGLLSPILHVVPLQLLAYHVALVRGTDVDKPRNLAKSVTVE